MTIYDVDVRIIENPNNCTFLEYFIANNERLGICRHCLDHKFSSAIKEGIQRNPFVRQVQILGH